MKTTHTPTEEAPTRVIFRTDGREVLAVFPRDPASSSHWWDCTCYAHVGQHSACDPLIVTRYPYRPATRTEYAPLARELRGLDYVLEIGARITRHDANARAIEWNRTRTAKATTQTLNPTKK